MASGWMTLKYLEGDSERRLVRAINGQTQEESLPVRALIENVLDDVAPTDTASLSKLAANNESLFARDIDMEGVVDMVGSQSNEFSPADLVLMNLRDHLREKMLQKAQSMGITVPPE